MAQAADIRVEFAEAVLPRIIVERIAIFLDRQISGKIEIDVANGQVTGFRVTEALRLDKRKT